jgi:hypothetical protein
LLLVEIVFEGLEIHRILALNVSVLLVDAHLRQLSCLVGLLAKVGLHVFEQGVVRDHDVFKLNSFDPDTPPGHFLLHFFSDPVAQLLSVLEDFRDFHIGEHLLELVPSLGAQRVIRFSRCVVANVLPQVLVGLVRAIVVSDDRPDERGAELDVLHVARSLLRKADLVNLRGKENDLVVRASESGQTDSVSFELSVVENEDPLVSLSFDFQRHQVSECEPTKVPSTVGKSAGDDKAPK